MGFLSDALDRWVARVTTPSPCIMCGAPPVAYHEGRLGTRHGFCAEHAAEAPGHGIKIKAYESAAPAHAPGEA